MTRGRDFRLPTDVVPRRYAVRFDLDLEAWTFRGSESIDVELHSARPEVYLHAVDIAVARAAARRDAQAIEAALDWDAEAEVVVLRFPRTLEAGTWTLELEFSGAIRPDLKAIYRSARGEERYAVTQLAPADARRAFPCFDEPTFKARFALELTGPAGLTAVANMRQTAAEDQGGGRTLWRFAETPRLSSYLLAFAVGPFEGTEIVRTRTGVPVRVWLPPGLARDGIFARDAHRAATEWLEGYTAIAYPYDKVEGLGIPDFSAGAMENPGAITYRLYLLAADPTKASTSVLKACVGVVAHELTHMWWGDLATLSWWDDIWLNEAFATFVGGKAEDALHPEWGAWREFVESVAPAFDLDALSSTHAIHAPAKNAEEAWQHFDAISYQKGAAVLRMLEAYLGEDVFRTGVRSYLERFREANATASDFWRALSDASGQDVVRLAETWITQPGHPLVRLRESAPGRVTLSQERFYLDPERASDEIWPVPLVLRAGEREQTALLDTRDGEVRVTAEWFHPNARAIGFYRYALDDALRARLLAHVDELRAEERLNLVDNEWALVRAGVARVASYLDLLRALAGERDRVVLSRLSTQLRWLELHALPDERRAAFAALVERIFMPRLDALGWDARAGEAEEDQQLRPLAIATLGYVARTSSVRDEAARRLRAHLDGRRQDRNLVGTIAAIAARGGDAALHARYLAHREAVVMTDPQEEQRFRNALGYFEDPAAAERSIAICLDGTIRDQDLAWILGEGLGNRAVRERYFSAIRDHWAARFAPLEASLRNGILVAAAQLTPPELARQVDAFLAACVTSDNGEVVARTRERLRVLSRAAQRISRELADALEPEVSLARGGR